VIRSDSGEPITEMSQRHSKSITRCFKTLDETDPASISIDLIETGFQSPSKTEPSIIVTQAGITSRVNEWHTEKAPFSIVPTLESRVWTTAQRPATPDTGTKSNNFAQEHQPMMESMLIPAICNWESLTLQFPGDETRSQLPEIEENCTAASSGPRGAQYFANSKAP
jgi:hypothetical protein